MSQATRIVQPDPNGPSYIRCDSSEAFVNPTNLSPREVNEKHLRLNLGLNISPEKYPGLVKLIRFLNDVLIGWWETHFFWIWQKIPLKVKRALMHWGWKIYYPLHKVLLGRSTAIHPDASPEYHAMYTIMYWGRYFPVTIQRMRFMLQQLLVSSRNEVTLKVENIHETITLKDVPERQKDHCTVRGLWMHADSQPTDHVIFWLYGGAFLAGDAHGNTGPADYIGKDTHTDVFIPEYRLVPESNLDDILWDVCLAYRWLQSQGRSKIILLGISSGGSLCARLAQLICECERGEALLPPDVKCLVAGVRKPVGAILLGPFADYTEPRTEAFLHYPKHDLVVNQGVVEYTHYLETHIPGDRQEYSPVHRSMKGLPPLCIVVSEHEVVYEQGVMLANRARSDGVKVTLGVWKYMCHVFTFLNAFIPEGEQSMQFTKDWIVALKEGKLT